MPTVYLSPSTQEWNPYINGGNEEYYMNLIADAMEPYLRSSGIRFVRNTPDMTAASSIVQSNQGNYGLHLAIHSNAAPEAMAGQLRGSEVYYAQNSIKGMQAAEIFADNLRMISPTPDLVVTKATDYLGEVTKTKAPAVLAEVAYHDNEEDAAWIKQNISEIGETLAMSVAEYFGVPFIPAQPARRGVVSVQSGWLNIRSMPSTEATIIARAWNGNPITVLGSYNGWYVVQYYNATGYAAQPYITLLDR